MVDFTTPVGLSSDGQYWTINVVNESSSPSYGNLTFNGYHGLEVKTALEMNDEFGSILIAPDVTNAIPPGGDSTFNIWRGSEGGALQVIGGAVSVLGLGHPSGSIGGWFSGSSWAGLFQGDVLITGELVNSSSVVSLDNPLDPENKYLNHANIGSSEMLNVYSGNAVLDKNGEAWVELAEWVEALNSDFRYQLTCIGGTSSVYIAEEVSGNRFKIAGGVSGMKISWQLTGVRKDPWAQEHPLIVDKEKSSNEKGCYYHPELYGQPEEKRICFAQYPEVMRQMKKGKEL